MPTLLLMENAGRGCAELLMRLNPEKKPTVILCGPGNNGGDGFVLARHLENHGCPVEVCLFAESEAAPNGKRIPKLSEDAMANYRIWESHHLLPLIDPRNNLHEGFVANMSNKMEAAGWIVDALFGTGVTRPLGGVFGQLVEKINASGKPVLAIDIPSGLDCDTGEPLGPTVRATHTATFVAPKRGFLNPKSREWTGEVHVIDIGAPRKLVDQFRGEPAA